MALTKSKGVVMVTKGTNKKTGRSVACVTVCKATLPSNNTKKNKKSKSKKKKRERKRVSKKKKRSVMKGGARLPLDFFGPNPLVSYSPSPNVNLDSMSAYGPIVSRSFGTVHPCGELSGPNLAVFPNSSGVKTGGSSVKPGSKSGSRPRNPSPRKPNKTLAKSS